MRTFVIATLLFGALACNDPEKSQENADKAQVQANQDKLKAQAEADRKQAQATEDLMKAKNDYRDTLNKLLTDVDKRTADLRASRLTAKPQDVGPIDQKLTTLGELRGTIATDTKTLDSVTAGTWETSKTQLDTDIRSVRNALLPVVGKT